MKANAYERIGVGYARRRQPDPRIAALVRDALAGSRRVLNVGAGSGSYEPTDRSVFAVEPSSVMVRQRPPGSAPAVQAVAERLPFPGNSFDGVMAILTVHHWNDRQAGYAELRRVAHRRVVLTYDPAIHNDFWLIRDYIPEVAALENRRVPTIAEVAEGIGANRVVSALVPHDCVDGVLPANWRRPHAYLDPHVRRAASGLAQADQRAVDRGIDRLQRDLASGRWQQRYSALLESDTFDAGFRILISD